MRAVLVRHSQGKRFIFHPLTILTCALLATVVFVKLMLPLRRFAGPGRFYLWAYHAPIGFAFVTYLFDRIERWSQLQWRQWLVELPVLALALTRTLLPVPYISGHALFLNYVLLTTPPGLAWWIAALVFIDVAYIKLVRLRDATLIGGIGVGLFAGLLVRLRFQPNRG